MSQDASTPQTVLDDLEPSNESSWWADEPEAIALSGEDPIAGAGLPVDSSADSLMDDLFADVDRMLEHGAQIPPEPAQPDYVALKPLSIPQMVLPPMLLPRPQLVETHPEEDLSDLVATMTSSEAPAKANPSIDRLLLSAVCASILASGILWIFSTRSPNPAPTTAAAPEQPPASQDSQFLDYMQRSLEVIDRRAASSEVAAAPPGAPPSADLPSVAVASSPTPDSGQTVLERVYIPVYQPPQTLYPVPSVAPPAPAAAPAAPAAAAPANVAAPAPSAVAVSPAAPGVPHVLMGVMQLGDRSAALFEISGVTQRIYIGESIGSSGWTLVSVSNQEAVVRRNGEVRSIYVGQQF